MKVVLSLFLLVVFSFNAGISEAHFRGQPFVKINNKSTSIYSVNELAKVNNKTVPSDIAEGIFLPNKKIDFKIDPSVLPFPEEINNKAKYIWNFGDGTRGVGESISHIYKKPGSYRVNIEIKYGDLSEYGFDSSQLPPTFQLILLNVLPDANYKVPKPIIKVEGRNKIINFLKNPSIIIELYNHFPGVRIPKNILFDASESVGKISDFAWDFDGKTASGARVSHSYSDGYFLNGVALKITDEKGFVAYAVFNIGNKDIDEGSEDKSPIINSNIVKVSIFGFIIIILSMGIMVLIKRKR